MLKFFVAVLYVLFLNDFLYGFEYDMSASDGPPLWGVDYPECAGLHQSPVDIDSATVNVGAPEFLRLSGPISNINPLPFTNNGHTLLLNLTTRNLRLVGSTFPDTMDAIQCHLHTPSEHTIGEVRYDLELHLVTGSVDRNYLGLRYPMAVVGLLYSISQQPGVGEDPLIHALLPSVSALSTASNTVQINVLPNIDIGTEFFEYDGSLTTPPCYEVVHWLVSTKIRYITPAQLAAFNQVMGNNSRPLQPLNGRPIVRRTMVPGGLSRYTSCSLSSSGSSSTASSQPASATTINFSGLFNGMKS